VIEQLQNVTVPAGVQPGLSSLSNSTGEIFRYTLVGKRPLYEMKALEDWTVEPAFRTVSGIADVVGFGGAVKQYQIDLDPAKLQGYGLALATVENAVANANQKRRRRLHRTRLREASRTRRGRVHVVDDIAKVAVANRNGAVVTVGDIGTVHIGGAPREGSSPRIQSRCGARDRPHAQGAKTPLEVAERRASKARAQCYDLAKDVRLVPFYDVRSRAPHGEHGGGESVSSARRWCW